MDPALLMEDDAVVEEPAAADPNEMLLQKEYTFWAFIKSSNRATDDWKPKKIASFKSVRELWGVY